jgi:hypothetical protein
VAGTDPQDPQSYLKVDQVDASGGATLRFIAISNKTYTIQFSDTLDNPEWHKLIDVNARVTNRNAVVADPGPGAGRYYRLVTPKLP